MNYQDELEIMGKRAKKASLALSILSCRVKNRALEAFSIDLKIHFSLSQSFSSLTLSHDILIFINPVILG